jgi:hypothetical protein
MNKLILAFLSYPIFLTPLLLETHAASAREFVFEAENNPTTCVEPNSNQNDRSNRFNLVCHRIKKEHQQFANDNAIYNDLVADFTEEESNAAVTLFGCDCPVCVNALRQLRGLSSTNS